MGVITAIFISCSLVAAAATGAIRAVSLRHGLLDIPNVRSSHQVATPRGGGAAVVLVVTIVAAILFFIGGLPWKLFAAIIAGGLPVASVGFLDDRHSIGAGTRLMVHVVAAAGAVMLLGGLGPLPVGTWTISLGWFGSVLAVLAIVWTLNLFNFMDGIDGIAASEALFVLCAGAFLTLGGGTSGTGDLTLACSAACAGFLVWNWPPARIFMGDVGSGYIGFLISVLALAAARVNPSAVWVWLILGGVFFVDSTTTLMRRALRGEQVHVAHRSHAYQWLSRRWHSHVRVTLAVMAINLLWLLPCAWFAAHHPHSAASTVVVALAPLIVLALAFGAGRKESVTGEKVNASKHSRVSID